MLLCCLIIGPAIDIASAACYCSLTTTCCKIIPIMIAAIEAPLPTAGTLRRHCIFVIA
jgi:hypothetical protein